MRVDIPLNAARLQLATAGRDGRRRSMRRSSAWSRTIRTRRAAGASSHAPPPGRRSSCSRPGPTTSSRARAASRRASGWPSVPATWCGARCQRLPAGRLSLSTKATGGASPRSGEPISYTVERIDGTRAGGRHHQPAGAHAAAAERALSRRGPLRPDERAHRARGRGQGRPDPAAGARASGRDAEAALCRRAAPLATSSGISGTRPGRAVWTSGQAEPLATLQAGRYLVRAETRDKRYERTRGAARRRAKTGRDHARLSRPLRAQHDAAWR